jgi:hypothetical protein
MPIKAKKALFHNWKKCFKTNLCITFISLHIGNLMETDGNYPSITEYTVPKFKLDFWFFSGVKTEGYSNSGPLFFWNCVNVNWYIQISRMKGLTKSQD